MQSRLIINRRVLSKKRFGRLPCLAMKIVIISDIHGNYDALRALPEEYDELWVLGDLQNYGPEPQEVVTEIMDKATVLVRGNHDGAVVSTEAAPSKSRWRVGAEATKQFTASVLCSATGNCSTQYIQSPFPVLGFGGLLHILPPDLILGAGLLCNRMHLARSRGHFHDYLCIVSPNLLPLQ
jgi:Calcineurin-like phosphoesterase superfamily domain